MRIALASGMKNTILTITLVAFVALNIAAVATGLDGLVTLFANATMWTELLMVDLVIALGLTCAWMVGDAKKRGRSAMGYVALTAFTGSIGPLVYLLRNR